MARSHLLAAIAVFICTVLLLIQLDFNLSDASSLLFKQSTLPTSDGIRHESDDATFLLGAGKADITGPVVEVNMMGYADTSQSGTGLRQRLYTRAFIIGSPDRPAERIVYLVLDTQSGDTAIRNGILDALAELGPSYHVYTKDNIAVTGTHSHSGPGAWLNYLLPQITSKGFNKDSYQAIVDGSVLAIRRAHESLTPGRLSFGSTKLTGANINRSLFAYLANPKAEREKYHSEVDTTMTVLKFERASDGHPIGMLSWFPVHGTSLYQNNTLITGDNKGVAAHLFEDALAGKNPDFVAGFSQANVGDTSPNVVGAFCETTGLECRFNDSTCDGKTQGCHGRGPYFRSLDQGTQSCFEIGRAQYAAARSAFDKAVSLQTMTDSTVSSFHTYANMSSYTFVSPLNSSRLLTTCSAALGHGFAGGTTDGPGAFDFRQGTNDSDDSPSLKNPLWAIARDFIHDPSDEQIICQHPKPILLDVGAAKKPYAWTPNIVDIQLLRVGPLVMIIAPGEATTMSGRRWRNAIAAAAPAILNITDPKVVLGGPANTYAHYIATEEEYAVQRYEGASTLYGPHTLAAYINLTLNYLPYLNSKSETSKLLPLPAGPKPPINVNSSLSFINPVVVDNAGFFRSFGQTLSSPSPSEVFVPGDVPATVFVGANPRNNLRLEGTFAAIEKLDPNGSWTTVRTDRDWHLVYKWNRKSTVLGTSEVTVEWEIEPWAENGMYRMHYYGDYKSIGGGITEFEGMGETFRVDGGKPELKKELARV